MGRTRLGNIAATNNPMVARTPLSGSTILVTGAGGGIGAEVALGLAKCGARIVLLDNDLAKLRQSYDNIAATAAVTPALYPFDLALANESQYQELADTLADNYGALQGLLHLAATADAFMPLQIHPTTQWGQAMNVNLHAPFLLCRVLLPLLQKSDNASIVFTGDDEVNTPRAYRGAYGVSKIAVQGLAGILAQELASAGKIRVNTVLPGAVNSPIRRKLFPAEDIATLHLPSDLCDIYQYLFSPASIGISGQTFNAKLQKK